MGSANIGRHLDAMAAAQPRAPALKVPRGRTRSGGIDYLVLSFSELAAETGAWSARLAARGVHRGDRALVMVRPGLPLIAAVFALFRIGAVPVVIDPGMGLKNLLRCVAQARPRALVGIPLAQLLSRAFRGSFRSVAVRVPVSGSSVARSRNAGPCSPIAHGLKPMPLPDAALARHSYAEAADLAAILFTSGSTGAPKGVRYEHGMFDAQVAIIRDTYGIAPGEVDLPLLPVFALFNPALGMTTVVPEVDPRRPAAADPAKIVHAIRQENVTNSFGSPTLWRMVADHCRARSLTLPSLRRVLCAGAPVPATLWADARGFLPNGRMHSPYGATEALPITTISDDEVASLTGGATSVSPCLGLKPGDTEVAPPLLAGTPVGRPVPGVAVKIIAIADGPIASLADARELPSGQIGEIIVAGPVVTKEYDNLPKATALAKIPIAHLPRQSVATTGRPLGSAKPALAGEDGSPIAPGAATAAPVWHRMGDCGTLDPEGRLWFCGRVAERVETPAGPMYTEPCERVFRRHPRAARCALIGLGERGRQVPALVAETRPKNAAEAQALAGELGRLAAAADVAISRFYFHQRFPVDVRHNAKIHRLALAKWAANAVGFEFDPHTR